jgi:LysR family transcriptional regulator, carnitine catabolism transcriptional activator
LTIETGARKHRFDISLEDLQTFVAVANLGGIGRAARHLHLSQPSVSNRIRRLEEKLNVRLLERNERGVQLTQQGRQLHQQAADTLLGLNELLQSFHLGNADLKRPVRLGVAVPMVQFKVPFLINLFQQRHPHAVVQIFEHIFEDAIDALMTGRCDFAILTCDDLPEALESETLLIDTTALLVSRDHPLGAQTHVKLEDALKYPVLLPGKRYPQLSPVYKAVEDRGLTMRLAPEAEGVRHPLTLMIMAAAGLGVVVSPASFIPAELSQTLATVVLSDCVIPRRLGLAWVKGRRSNPVAQAFQAFMSANGRDLRSSPGDSPKHADQSEHRTF